MGELRRPSKGRSSSVGPDLDGGESRSLAGPGPCNTRYPNPGLQGPKVRKTKAICFRLNQGFVPTPGDCVKYRGTSNK